MSTVQYSSYYNSGSCCPVSGRTSQCPNASKQCYPEIGSGSVVNDNDYMTISREGQDFYVGFKYQYAGQTLEFENNDGLLKTLMIYPEEPTEHIYADGSKGYWLVPEIQWVPTKDTSAAQSWAMGIDFSQEHLSSYYPGQIGGNYGLPQILPLNRSKAFQQADKMMLQNRIDDGEKKLNEKIANILKQNNIELGSGEKLDFSVDQDGVIKLGDGVSADKKDAIERALNADSSLGHELLLSQAQRRFADSGNFMNDGVTRNIVIKAYERHSGDSGYSYTKTNDGKELTYSFDFTYQNGALVRDDGLSDDRVFNNRPDVFDGLGKMVGLDDTPADTASFIDSLRSKIAGESEELTTLLGGMLGSAGMDDVTKKITFAEGENGYVIVEGNLRADQKRKLERLINDDPELAERIKDQKARMEILGELENSQKDGIDLNGVPAGELMKVLEEAERELKENPHGAFDNYQLDSDKLAAARQQLLKSYLTKNGVSLNDVTMQSDENGSTNLAIRNADAKTNESFLDLLGEFRGLEGELKHLLESVDGKSAQKTDDVSVAKSIGSADSSSEEPRALLSMKRGELSEATDEEGWDFKKWAQEIRASFTKVGETEEQDGIITKYNKKVGKLDPDLEIVDFTVKIDDKGRITLTNIKTRGGTEEQNRQAEKGVNSLLNTEGRELWNCAEFAQQVLDHHDDEHGDVEEFEHQVYIDARDFDGYRIESPDADRAAMDELNTLSGEIGASLNEYFKQFRIDETFNIHWDVEKGLSLDESFANGKHGYGPAVSEVLNRLNERIFSDDPMNDERFGYSLEPQLEGILDKFLKLKEVQDKFHTAEMKKTGITFTIFGKKD